MTEKEKMLAGEIYSAVDPQLVEELTEARRIANRIYNIHERAIAYHDSVCPKMDAIRYEIDHLEMIVEDGLWSLPKYRELLFIR